MRIDTTEQLRRSGFTIKDYKKQAYKMKLRYFSKIFILLIFLDLSNDFREHQLSVYEKNKNLNLVSISVRNIIVHFLRMQITKFNIGTS